MIRFSEERRSLELALSAWVGSWRLPVVGSDISRQKIAVTRINDRCIDINRCRRTASYTNSIQAKKAGAVNESDGRPSAKIANVMCPANDTESTVACAKNVQREIREIPEGVRLLFA